MGLLDDYSTGIGMPRPKWEHQLAMNRMHARAYYELEPQGLVILTEATVTDDWDDLAPDLVIFDPHFQPLSIIEITTHRYKDDIIDKCCELIERFPNAEYFVYDYEHQVLYMYSPADDCWLSSDQYELYSQYLHHPVIEYLK